MRPTRNPTVSTAALDYDSTMISALELSSKKWVFAVQLPGVNKHTRHVLAPNGAALVELIERLKARSKAAGLPIARVIVTHEAGRDGFWLARFLQRRGVEVHVMQSSSSTGRSPGATRQDRRDRCRDAIMHIAGVAARRTARLFDGPDSARRRRGGAPSASRTRGLNRRAAFDPEQDRGDIGDIGDRRLPGLAARPALAIG